MAVIPGVIDSKSNFVEHPEVVAQRIEAVVDALGDKERVIAGVDCGFGTFVGWEWVAEDVVWAKLNRCAKAQSSRRARFWQARQRCSPRARLSGSCYLLEPALRVFELLSRQLARGPAQAQHVQRIVVATAGYAVSVWRRLLCAVSTSTVVRVPTSKPARVACNAV